MAAGDTNLFFNRDTKLYLVQGSTTWELPVLTGYSFTQSTNSSDITLNEMSDASGRSRRGMKKFNDSLAPAEWSFDMYARPTIVSATYHRAPEEALWNSLFSKQNFTVANATTGFGGTITATFATASGITTVTLTYTGLDPSTKVSVGDAINVTGITASTNAPNGTFVVTKVTSTTIEYVVTLVPTGSLVASSAIVRSGQAASTTAQLDFSPLGSNKSSLATFDLYFVLGASSVASANYLSSDATTIYKVADCCVNEATMNFEVDGISTISWSGMGKTISELATYDASTALQIGITSTSNMIRNRLTSATIIGSSPSAIAKTYLVNLTGGSITISNNMTFLTPETLGVVNVPLGHVTGGRSVSGSLTFYADELTNGSLQLYEDMLTAVTSGTQGSITNKFAIAINVGGTTAPYVLFDMGQCHLEIPSINIDDVIAFEANFAALPSTISNADEITKIRYVGV